MHVQKTHYHYTHYITSRLFLFMPLCLSLYIYTSLSVSLSSSLSLSLSLSRCVDALRKFDDMTCFDRDAPPYWLRLLLGSARIDFVQETEGE
jgi:hypothetical protein